MNWNTLWAGLAMQPPPGSGSSEKARNAQMIGIMVIMGVMMYFLMIRPQRQRQKQLEALLKSIKPGDKILTSSGIVGVVLTVKERTVTIRSADTKLEVLKSAVSEVTEKAGESASEPTKN